MTRITTMKVKMKQSNRIRDFLKWLDTCPFDHKISSMQGNTVCFVRFWLEEPSTGNWTEEEQEEIEKILQKK